MSVIMSEEPYWANNKFFENILESENKNTKIKKFSLKIATAKGDNYLSTMYRAKLEYTNVSGKTVSTSIIIKCMPEGDMTETLITEMGVFPKEIRMYSLTLPTMEKIMFNAGLKIELCPRFMHKSNSKPVCIVMSDLAERGFRMAERTIGLDLDHCKLLIEKMAYMHASSIVMAEKNPSTVECYDFGMFNPKTTGTVEDMFTGGLGHLVTATETWPGCEKYSTKLMALMDTFMDRSKAAAKMNPNGFNVLNHGDLWVNNTMYQYGPTGKPLDVVFVDYQLSNWSSPAVDFHYFMNTSPTTEVRNNHRDFMLELYYNTLVSTLAALKYSPIPTLKDIQKDLDEREFYGVLAAVAILPLIIREKEGNVGGDMESMLDKSPEGVAARALVSRGKNYELAMRGLLPYFDKKGLLD